MLPGGEHRRNPNSWSDFVRPRPDDSRIWVGVPGRNRRGREKLPESTRQQERERRQAGCLFHPDCHQDGHGLRRRRNRDGGDDHSQWPPSSVRFRITCLLITLVWTSSCSRRVPPQNEFEGVYEKLVQGRLTECLNDTNSAYSRFKRSDPPWATRFRILGARALLEQGRFDEALEAAESSASSSEDPEVRVSAAAIAAVALANTHRFEEARRRLAGTLPQCDDAQVASCGELFQALGILADERSDPSAEREYQRCLSFARLHHNAFLESNSLLNLGNESLTQGRFDEAATRSQNAYESATKIGARVVALIAKGNVGWALYRLGDLDGALELSLQAEKEALATDDIFDRENLLTNLGYIYMDRHKFELAEKNFREALELAKNINAEQDKYNALRVLAKLGLQTGDLNGASENADQALLIAQESHNHPDELYPMLVKAQVAARRGDVVTAQRIFESIEGDPSCPVFLKWEAQHFRAELYEAQNQPDKASQEYRGALATFEAARATVQHQDFQLSFLTNAAQIYDDYVHFLVVNGKTDDALRWADFSRARTLSEGLGLLSQNQSSPTGVQVPIAPELKPQVIARRAKGTLLFYWLGEKQSYLWATDSTTTHLFTLPPRSDIEAAVQRYRSALNGTQDVLQSGGEDGRTLYQILIAPAASMLPPNAKVFIFLDGSLNNLNFETLIVPSPKPHYWIEDADV